ncbi:hypothetical protein [Desulfonatronum thiodismutans]|uniref:hypothetical protein n=1 Tax=Desulfonatronum thiodismutans TaxID=159290 RepID=UPI001267C544|nr:hypothetical protein [Desulfonatronum thiodismutans]
MRLPFAHINMAARLIFCSSLLLVASPTQGGREGRPYICGEFSRQQNVSNNFPDKMNHLDSVPVVETTGSTTPPLQGD